MPLMSSPLVERASFPSANSTSTNSAITSQWSNPSDVLSVLLIIGGEVVQAALAQSSGHWFSPVCFSFGWVAYSFIALINVMGDGRLLPIPDYPVKVFNLKTGYARENKNWVVGRLLRDNESYVSKTYPLSGNGLRISIYEALNNNLGPVQARWTRIHIIGLVIMIIQLAVASISIIIDREWGILLITGSGTVLALMAGALPQWRAEKLPTRQDTDKVFALTSGNGASDIMIIKGLGKCLDLEELSASDTPRTGRPWEKFIGWGFSRPRKDRAGVVMTHKKSGKAFRDANIVLNHPVGFWVTRIMCVLQSILWLALLITVAGLKSNTWYLLLVGGIGMFQNAFLAAAERKPADRNLRIALVDVKRTKKVMDGLMDLEASLPKAGRYLRGEFFPGDLRPEEEKWWKGETAEYDEKRWTEKAERGYPKSNALFSSPHSTFNEETKTNDCGDWSQSHDRSATIHLDHQDILLPVSGFPIEAPKPTSRQYTPSNPQSIAISYSHSHSQTTSQVVSGHVYPQDVKISIPDEQSAQAGAESEVPSFTFHGIRRCIEPLDYD